MISKVVYQLIVFKLFNKIIRLMTKLEACKFNLDLWFKNKTSAHYR